MASPIVECQKALLKANNQIERMKSDAEKHVLRNLAQVENLELENKFLRTIIARKELQKSMITSMFDKALESAGTISEARNWWKGLLTSANGIPQDADDWEDQAMRVTANAGINWSQESIQQNMRELLDEYQVTNTGNGLNFWRS